VIYATAVVMVFGAVNLMRTRYGEGLLCDTRQRPGSRRNGDPIFRYKLLSFAVSFLLCRRCRGSMGLLHDQHHGGAFHAGLSVEYIAMIIIGGSGVSPGHLGTVFITLLNEGLRWSRTRS